MKAYKLVRKRKDGTYGPLFINARLRIPMGEWMPAECHPTKGFAVRPGWHCTAQPVAPHLKSGEGSGRVWMEVEIRDFEIVQRPENQGGKWYLAEEMRFVRELFSRKS